MEKKNGSDRQRRERNQQTDHNQDWNQQSDYNRSEQAGYNQDWNQRFDTQNRERENSRGQSRGQSYSGLSPNYESNYRPGEYGQYSNRNRRSENDYGASSQNAGNENAGNDFGRNGGNDFGSNDRIWNNNQNDRGWNDNQSAASGFNQEDRNLYGSAGRRDWSRLGSPSYERGENRESRDQSRGSQDVNRSQNTAWGAGKDQNSTWGADENAQYGSGRDQNAQHKGKGPKGYTRSDERITEDVNERLTNDGHIDANDISAEVHNGEVVLTGTVKTRQEKRRTEDIIDNIFGVKNVENRLKVQAQSSNSNEGQYTNGLRERKGGLEYGPGAVSGMANTSPTGDLNTAR